MVFWGIEVEPGTPYVYRSVKKRGRLHVTQATLDGHSRYNTYLRCKVGDMKPIYLCSLTTGTCQLNLEFEEDEVIFSINGYNSMHLSGFFYGNSDDQDDIGHDCDFDSCDEDFVVNGFKNEDDSEDDCDYIDDGFEMYPPSPIQNNGVKVDEVVDDEKVNNENDSYKQKTAQTKSAETNGEKAQKKSDKGDAVHGNKLERKVETVDLDGNHTSESIEQGDSAVQFDTTILPENNEVRNKNKNLKVEDKVEVGLPNPYATIKLPAAESENDLNPSSEKKKGKQEKNKQPGSRLTPIAEDNSTNGNSFWGGKVKMFLKKIVLD